MRTQDESQKGAATQLHEVEDEHSGIVARSSIAANEHTLACLAIFLLACAKPRAAPSDVAQILDLLLHLNTLHPVNSPHSQGPALKNAYHVLFALLELLQPVQQEDGGESESDKSARVALRNDGAMQRAFGALPPGATGFVAVAKLAWGVMVAETHDLSLLGADSDAALRRVGEGLKSGAMRFSLVRPRLAVIYAVCIADSAMCIATDNSLHVKLTPTVLITMLVSL